MEQYHADYILKHQLVGAGLHELAQKVRTITHEEAMKDYEALKKEKPGTNLMGRIGNKAMDYFFFEPRLATGSRRGDNEAFPDFFKRHGWNDATSYKRLFKMGTDKGQSSERSAYSVFNLYWGAISAFKPLVARMLYDKYKAKTVLDFSAGWGGRMLGAMSLDINYIGFDTNTDLRKPYADMIKMYPHKSNVRIIFQDSSKVDYSKYKYDMVFTSPPYYLKTKPTEAYKNMPQYKDRDDFNQRFFFPVVQKSYDGLQSGGHYCLNIPQDMYEDIKSVLGKYNGRILLPKVQRGGSGEGTYKEYIYIWNKGAKKIKGDGHSEFLPASKVKNDLVKVAKSPTHGRGVFALQDIPKGARIADYNGDEMFVEDFKKKYGDDYRYTYSLGTYGKKRIISGKSTPYLTSNVSHYTNESESPNVFLQKRGLYALKPIKAGDELFLKYPKNYPRDYKL